jgi:ribokinase
MIKIAVIGNINIDLILRIDDFPVIGETKLLKDLIYRFGGKGANQAVAARRLGAEVYLIGGVGNDTFGDLAIHNLSKENVDISFIKRINGISTGTAVVLSKEDGANSIMTCLGANLFLTPEEIEKTLDLIRPIDLILIQLGVPLNVVEHTLEYAHNKGIPLLLDPTPLGRGLPNNICKASIITPNRIELKTITGLEDEKQSLDILYKKGVSVIVLKDGENGCFIYSQGKIDHIPPFKNINSIDTTGAGDTFNAALGFCIAQGTDLKKAALFANAAGALATTKLGAQEGMPTQSDVDELIRQKEM